MSKLTNKVLLENKNNRYELIVFGHDGVRASSHANIDILDATNETIQHTTKGYDVLLLEYDPVKSIKICTELESILKRRAIKFEIIEFFFNSNKLTVEIVKNYATENYNNGGDAILNCWDDEEIQREIFKGLSLERLAVIIEMNAGRHKID